MSPLEPSLADQREILDHAVAAVVGHAATIGQARVSPGPGEPPVRDRIAEVLAAVDGGATSSWEHALATCVEVLDDAVHPTHPRYFGLFNPTSALSGVVADLLVSAFNPQLAAWSHAPAACTVEEELIGFLGRRFGLPEPAGGFFTSGGAEANAGALHLALTHRFPEIAESGLRALAGSPTIYASAASHLAWLKIVHTTGLGRRALRLVPVDAGGRLRPDALRSMIEADRDAGAVPALIVATMGATATGAVDPAREISEIAAANHTHMHVDAAWAGALCLSDSSRSLLRGIETADSVTVDPHKWLSMPMGCGALVTRHVAALGSTYHATTSYMPDPVDSAADPYTHSPQWSRRFRGMGLLLALLTAGLDGYDRQLSEDVRLGNVLRDGLVRDGWVLANETALPVVCIVDPYAASSDAHHRAIADAVVANGRAWVSTVSVGERTAIRACITSHRTTEADVGELVTCLRQARDDARS